MENYRLNIIIQLLSLLLSTGCNRINSVSKIIKHIAVSLLFSDYKKIQDKNNIICSFMSSF